jgi:hypothetical protein
MSKLVPPPITAADLARISGEGQELIRVPLDLPAWAVEALDEEARALGVSREIFIRHVVARYLAED